MNVPIIEKAPVVKGAIGPGTGLGRDVTATSYTSTREWHLTRHYYTPATSKGFFQMISDLMRQAKQNKGLALWNFVRYAISATYFWIGGTFLFGADHVHIEATYHLIENIEPGGIRFHGAILFILALVVASKPAFRKQTRIGLLGMMFYSFLSTFLIAGGWVIHKPDLSAPAWYLLVAALSFALIASVPLAAKGRLTRNGGTCA